MTLDACARLVERGDPDRFRAAMAAPPEAREALFPIYAFNLEVARAPWVTKESLIAEMRLQWWRDVLANAVAGAPPLAHEFAGPLASLIQARRLDVAPLDAVIEGRRIDIEARPLAASELPDYLEATAGQLLWASCVALGEDATLRDAVLAVGRAGGLASWLVALPELTARGRGIEDPATLRPIVEAALADLAHARRSTFRKGVPALRAHWMAGLILRAALRDPTAGAGLVPPEGRKRLRLLGLALTGRW